MSGRLVRRIENQDCQLGYNQVSWDGADAQGVRLPNGVYLYRLSAPSRQTRARVAEARPAAQVIEKFIVRR